MKEGTNIYEREYVVLGSGPNREKMTKCTESGCLNLKTICNDCGRVVCKKTLPPSLKWVFPVDQDKTTWWPRDKRVLACDANGWVNILKMTEHGFELDDGGEAGDMPIAWMNLPEFPADK
jgi:hypothetical protein